MKALRWIGRLLKGIVLFELQTIVAWMALIVPVFIVSYKRDIYGLVGMDVPSSYSNAILITPALLMIGFIYIKLELADQSSEDDTKDQSS